ncbi:hypothetical protein PS425_09175 [Limosilactobacillus fermentum]
MNIEAVHTVGNIGAGTMGHATALQFALKGTCWTWFRRAWIAE